MRSVGILLVCGLAGRAAAGRLEHASGTKRSLSGTVDARAGARAVERMRRSLERCFEAGFYTASPTVELDVVIGVLGGTIRADLSAGPTDVGGCVARELAGVRWPRPRPERAAEVRVRIEYRLGPSWRTSRVQGRLGQIEVAPRPGSVVAPDDSGIDPLASLPGELVETLRSRVVSVYGPGRGTSDNVWRRWDLYDADGDRIGQIEAPDERPNRPNDWKAVTEQSEIEWSTPGGGHASERYQEDFTDGRHEVLTRTTRARWRGGRWVTVEERIFGGATIRVIRLGNDGRRHVSFEPMFIS
jgi:hypothetical protein